MLRAILCAAVALCFCADVALAKGGKSKTPKPVIGTVKSVDTTTGIVTVTVTSKKKGSTDKTFTVSDDTAFVVTKDDASTKDVKGKDGLKDPVMKEGVSIKVTSDATGAVTEVAIGGTYAKAGKKKKSI